MRSIIKKKDKSKRNQLILGVFLIVVMFFSIIGFALGGIGEENNQKIEYNGIEFIQDDSGYWHFNIQGYGFITRYNPEEVKDINFFNSLTINNYAGKPLYFVGDSDGGVFEISRNLGQFVLRMNPACLNKKDCLGDFPIKNCSVDNVIVIKASGDGIEEIRQDENCVFIIADLEKQIRYVDAFLFRVLGI